MNPIRASLRYPQVTLVLTAMMFAAGVAAFLTMPRREDPKITIRSGLVIASYPGATAEEVEDQVTRKIEERLFRFSEVRREKTYSTSRNGLVVVNVELNKSVKNSDEFWSKLRLDMAQLKQTDLPSGVQGPIVDSDFGDTVAALIAVKGGHYEYRELTDYAKRVESAIREIPAVSKIKRIGDQKETVQVTGSMERLSQYGVDPQKVEQALQGRNTIVDGGRVPRKAASFRLRRTDRSRPKSRSGRSWSMYRRPDSPFTWAILPMCDASTRIHPSMPASRTSQRSFSPSRCTRDITSCNLAKPCTRP